MTLDSILTAPPLVQVHIVAALSAILLGPMALWRRSRDKWHKRLGYSWVIAMAVTALSSFGISGIKLIGPFSPIHALSVLTIFGLWQGINAARKRRIAEHRKAMQSLYFWAMGIAGLFTFLPGRRMNEVFFSAAPVAGFIVMALFIGAALIWYLLSQRQALEKAHG